MLTAYAEPWVPSNFGFLHGNCHRPLRRVGAPPIGGDGVS
jgi:hypothetical protein